MALLFYLGHDLLRTLRFLMIGSRLPEHAQRTKAKAPLTSVEEGQSRGRR